MIKFVLHKIANGIWIFLFLGVLLALFNSFLARMDLAVQNAASIVFSVDLHYTGLGIVILLMLAFVLGLVKGIKVFGVTISFGTLVGLLVSGKLKRVLSSPVIEVEIYPGIFFRGWLVDIVNERIRRTDGTVENFVAYYCFLPSGNNPTSGQMPRVDVEKIKYILRRPSGRLLANVFSFGTSGNDWKRIEFNSEDYPPHNTPPEDSEK